MRSHQSRARSGPHSIQDARQHAWTLLIFGPGMPAWQRPHRGMLPDVAERARPPRHPSIIARFIARFLRSSVETAEEAREGVEARPGHSKGEGLHRSSKRTIQEEDRLAA